MNEHENPPSAFPPASAPTFPLPPAGAISPHPGPHAAVPYSQPGAYAQHPGVPYPVQHPGGGAVQVVSPKTAGVAVLLSFLWLGAGHLYAGKTGVGIALMILDMFYFMTAFIIVGVVLWVITVPFVMWLSANAAHNYNRRNGIVVR